MTPQEFTFISLLLLVMRLYAGKMIVKQFSHVSVRTITSHFEAALAKTTNFKKIY